MSTRGFATPVHNFLYPTLLPFTHTPFTETPARERRSAFSLLLSRAAGSSGKVHKARAPLLGF